MTQPHTPPAYKVKAFHCPNPRCRAFSRQVWAELLFSTLGAAGPNTKVPNILLSRCEHCGHDAIWRGDRLVCPAPSSAPSPNPDLSPAVLGIYKEAADISPASPRAACALLRLAIEMLCTEQTPAMKEKASLNDRIGQLVADGLPTTIQQALDVVRVIGNGMVHPREISDEDKGETAVKLFHLVNLITNHLITQPKALAAQFGELPDGAKDGIEKRDRK